jgi:putative ATPase
VEREPLAWRFKPHDLSEFVGQDHLISAGKPLRIMIERDLLRSAVFYGPPGTGKTCLAHIIADRTQALFFKISAVTSGKKEIKEVLATATKRWGKRERTLLFVDEIHRFNKVQQETLLPAVERGEVILIGASTENPYFALVHGLRSRTQVFHFHPLDEENLVKIMEKALTEDSFLAQMKGKPDRETLISLAHLASGDARIALNNLELAMIMASDSHPPAVTPEIVEEVFQKRIPYDKQTHYNAISAFIKSLRGSDPDATIFWLAFMLEAGEDPLYIARRIVIAASEDVGLADPSAIIVASAALQGVKEIGLPEAELILAHAALHLATAPKSNSAYKAIKEAQKEVRSRGNIQVPDHLKDASSYTKARGEYIYPHDHPHHFVLQYYMPLPKKFYRPTLQGKEAKIKERLEKLWGKKHG